MADEQAPPTQSDIDTATQYLHEMVRIHDDDARRLRDLLAAERVANKYIDQQLRNTRQACSQLHEQVGLRDQMLLRASKFLRHAFDMIGVDWPKELTGPKLLDVTLNTLTDKLRELVNAVEDGVEKAKNTADHAWADAVERLLEEIGAEAIEGSWTLPIYGPDGREVQRLSAKDWVSRRKQLAIEIEAARTRQDIGNFIAKGQIETGLVMAIREAAQHLEGGREKHALDLLQKVGRRAATVTGVQG